MTCVLYFLSLPNWTHQRIFGTANSPKSWDVEMFDELESLMSPLAGMIHIRMPG